jgi:ATP citrate (pro-S)-lyase
MSDCMKQHRDADVLINFASLRSAYESTIETMKYPQVNKKRFLRFLFVL